MDNVAILIMEKWMPKPDMKNMKKRWGKYSYDEYAKAMEMLKKMGPTEVSSKLGIPLKTIEGWKRRGHKPPLAKWIPEPSSELAYITGVLLGDGCLYTNQVQYRILLIAKDLEFVETFSRTMAKLLNRKYLAPKLRKTRNVWRVIYTSKALYTWFKQQTMETLKQYIEYNKETVANFLKGMYDSEGGYYRGRYIQIHLSNTNLELLRYIQYLLKKYFDIIARGPYLTNKAGTKHKIRNKMLTSTHNVYRITIYRKQYIQRFLNEIGFSIRRKQLGLPRRKK